MQVVNVYNDKNFDVYIGRPSQGGEWGFGNPFVIGRDGDREECVEKFKLWLEKGTSFGCQDAIEERRQWILKNVKELKEKVLGCFCFPARCHGEVLVKLCSGRQTKQPR